MPVAALKKFLDRHEVRYVVIIHSPAFTAQEIAASAHIPGKELAKTVMVKTDGRLAMAVLPASAQVDFPKFKEVAGVFSVELASEADFRDTFPECELGAMPPFGILYDMEVYLDRSLSEDEEIAFNAGTHSELIRIPFREYMRLVRPTVGDFAKF